MHRAGVLQPLNVLLIAPIWNGNYNQDHSLGKNWNTFNRTNLEWKQRKMKRKKPISQAFNRTNLEWKLECCMITTTFTNKTF